MVNLTEILAVGIVARTIVPLTKDYYFLFAILTIFGGIMGFVKAKSKISLISGSISGIILIVAATLLPLHPIPAEVIGICISVLLAGKFLPDYLHKKAFIPGGLMAILSVIGIVISIVALTK